MTSFDIIYEDHALIVCYKPAGIATETKRIGQQDMVSLLRNYRMQKGEEPYIGMVHRLDQPVEGLLVFVKTKEAAVGLTRQVQAKSIGKYYYAIGHCMNDGDVQPQGTLENYILFDKKRNISSVVSAGTPQAKTAVLDYRVIGQKEKNICFAITLHTGRHHQIRAQFANLGYPLLGDAKYGEKEPEIHQLALCSCRLAFEHPVTGEKLDFSVKPHNKEFEIFLQGQA